MSRLAEALADVARDTVLEWCPRYPRDDAATALEGCRVVAGTDGDDAVLLFVEQQPNAPRTFRLTITAEEITDGSH